MARVTKAEMKKKIDADFAALVARGQRKQRAASFAASAPRWNGTKRPERLELRLTSDEATAVHAAAGADKLPTATWARRVLCAAAKPHTAKAAPAKKGGRK